MSLRWLTALHDLWRLGGARGLRHALRARLYTRGRYLRFCIDLPLWQPPPIPPGVTIRSGLSELVRFRALAVTPLPLEFWADRIQGARRPYLGLADGRVGHISWLFTEGDHTRLVRLGPGEVEVDFAYTFPEARGRRLLTAVETAMLLEARREGGLTAYTHVGEDNTASIRGVLKTGFRAIGIVTLRWIAGVPVRRFVPYAPSSGQPAAAASADGRENVS